MKFNELCKKIDRPESFISFGRVVQFVENKIIVDGEMIDETFDTIEEAKEFANHLYHNQRMESEVITESYEELPEQRIATFITEHHDVDKVTEQLIESYCELASTKMFSIDPVVTEIRIMNSVDSIVEGKLDYKLDDDSIVCINEETQRVLNNLLKERNEIVDFMRENTDNFMHVVDLIEE